MNRKRLLAIILSVVLSMAVAALAASWPDDALQKANGFHELEKDKKDMPPSMEGVPVISGDAAHALWKAKKAIFLDTRVKTQYDTEKIAGAQWLFCDDFMKDPSLADNLDKGKEYVLYCNGIKCWRSPAVAVLLHQLGFKKLHWYRDGIPDWKKKGYPTE